MTGVVTVRRPEAQHFTRSQRDAILEWLAANGAPIVDVICVELLAIDVPMIAVTRKVRDDTGRTRCNPVTKEILTVTTDHLQRVPPPDFWQPDGAP